MTDDDDDAVFARAVGVSPNHRKVLLEAHARLCDEQAHRG
jgi:hypothetical protein